MLLRDYLYKIKAGVETPAIFFNPYPMKTVFNYFLSIS
jgi:hypothetical protein